MSEQKTKSTVKNQHFVPRCLLRRFSPNSKTTSVFVIGTERFVPTAGIATQCAEDYFYGKVQDTEKALGALEGAFSKAIGDLSEATIEGMTEEDLAVVRAFVHVQAERTPFAADSLYDSMLDVGDQLVVAFAKANKIEVGNIEAVRGAVAKRIADEHMPNPAVSAVELARRHQESIADLEVKFVMAERLMISDHPAFSLNFWRDQHPKLSQWPTPNGLLTKGFMYVMPVSTSCFVLIYDPSTYDVGTADSRIVRATEEDQTLINCMQAVNATRMLFDSNIVIPDDLIAALEFRNAIRKEFGEGPLSIHDIGVPLSFLRVTDTDPHNDWTLAMLPTRTPLEDLKSQGRL